MQPSGSLRLWRQLTWLQPMAKNGARLDISPWDIAHPVFRLYCHSVLWGVSVRNYTVECIRLSRLTSAGLDICRPICRQREPKMVRDTSTHSLRLPLHLGSPFDSIARRTARQTRQVCLSLRPISIPPIYNHSFFI